jgi:hypothetical protein
MPRRETTFKSIGRGRSCTLCDGTDGSTSGADSLLLCRRETHNQGGLA